MLAATLLRDCWVQLYSAIALELGGTLAVKYSEGFSRLIPSACVIGLYSASFFIMSQAVKKIELGVAYAIWSGVGIIATSVLGVILFNESITLRKFISVAIILVGVVSLNLTATE
ncbi:multidrug efflux SMR transporter [Pseudodesulfovibrio sp.]|uniref:DMT family transporter n=1 Tax=Pseudodesulfovibrio sp. TaxID=2035812 RepID=UPI00261C85C6|nr:multidrug efflux SMR transporter [Pseudodesulfovibrio sp.]MDD3311224.1 multidrug efflux SMR transporter [Pseudodesulfovibrio sp.]